jgi:F-type H+-transporting ATPase subunit b
MNINVTLIGQLAVFVVFVWFTMKYVWTPIMHALEARRKEIAAGLAAAERGQHEQQLAQERSKEFLKEAKDDARGEGERILTAARAEIEQESNRAREELRARIGELAIAGAEKILRKEINADTHKGIVEQLAKEI